MEFNVADLVEAAADAVPERDALVAGEVRHSFRSLDQRANRAAHHLAASGVGAMASDALKPSCSRIP